MTERYPVMLSLEGKKAVVMGGGKIASRKINGLLRAGAHVTVVSPEISESITQWHNQELLQWEQRAYRCGDEKTGWVVIAATDQPEVNAEIAGNTDSWQLVNVIDQAELGNFYTPAQISRGKLMLTVGTDGASPSLTRKIQAELDQWFPDTFGDYVAFLASCREKVKAAALKPERKRQILTALLDPCYQDAECQKHVLNDFNAFLDRF